MADWRSENHLLCAMVDLSKAEEFQDFPDGKADAEGC
jgi:hypothetical protein